MVVFLTLLASCGEGWLNRSELENRGHNPPGFAGILRIPEYPTRSQWLARTVAANVFVPSPSKRAAQPVKT